MNLIKLGWRQCFLRNILQRNMFMLHMLIISHIPTLLNHNIYTTLHARHTTHTKHVYTPHSHHAYIYGRVYSYTYCGRKGHLAKFCFDRINASNDHVWVRRTNSIGPKKIWVPKSTNLLLDMCTHQGSKT